MTNLDSILKTRDITLPTKVRLVKAMVFPVVMYGCESWLDGITDSMDVSLSELQELVWTGKPDVLQSMGSQRVGHD